MKEGTKEVWFRKEGLNKWRKEGRNRWKEGMNEEAVVDVGFTSSLPLKTLHRV